MERKQDARPALLSFSSVLSDPLRPSMASTVHAKMAMVVAAAVPRMPCAVQTPSQQLVLLADLARARERDVGKRRDAPCGAARPSLRGGKLEAGAPPMPRR